MSGMPDIVERLRRVASQNGAGTSASLHTEAADTIEAQQATITELREALGALLTASQPQHSLKHVFLGEAQERALALLTKLREQNT